MGKAGLELQYESELRGTYGQETAALDANGQPIPGLVSQVSAPVPGESLTLSVSVHEQQIATQALQWGLKQAGLKQGRAHRGEPSERRDPRHGQPAKL